VVGVEEVMDEAVEVPGELVDVEEAGSCDSEESWSSRATGFFTLTLPFLMDFTFLIRVLFFSPKAGEVPSSGLENLSSVQFIKNLLFCVFFFLCIWT
jgi:hypothetical protein